MMIRYSLGCFSFLIVLTLIAASVTAQDTDGLLEGLDDNLFETPKASPDAANGSVARELSSIADHMSNVAAALEAYRGSNRRVADTAVGLQRDILVHLDALLRTAGTSSKVITESADPPEPASENQTGSQSKEKGDEIDIPRESSSAMPEESGSTQPESQRRDDQKAEDDGDTPNANPGTSATSTNDRSIKVELREAIESSGMSRWGRLPEQIRQALESGAGLEFSEGFEDATNTYFRMLNETANQGSR